MKYLKHFENPNAIVYKQDDKLVDIEWFYSTTWCFSYYDGVFVINENTTHDELFDEYLNDSGMEYEKKEELNTFYKKRWGRGELSGRLFVEEKVITFWYFPKNGEELKKLIYDIEREVNFKIWNKGWKVEICKDDEINEGDWGSWSPEEEKNTTYVPVEEYLGSKERKEDELKMVHLMNWAEKQALKKKIGWGRGWGSDMTAWDSKNPLWWRQAKYQESKVYEKLGISEPVYQVSKRFYDYLIQNVEFGKRKIDLVFPKELYQKEFDDVLKFNFQYRPNLRKRLYGHCKTSIVFSGEVEGVYQDYFECTLLLTIKPELSKIAHEIQHAYEYTNSTVRGKIMSDSSRNFYYNVTDEKFSNVADFIYNIYFSQKDEMNARVQEFYHRIKDRVHNLEDFKKEVINSQEYGYAKDLKEMGENFTILSKENSDSCLEIVNSLKIDQKQLNDLLIDTPNNLLRKLSNYFISKILPKFIQITNEKESVDFIGKWGHIFTEKGDQYTRKLWRLWDLLKNNEDI